MAYLDVYPSFDLSGCDLHSELALLTTDPEVTCNTPYTIASIDPSVAKTVSYKVTSKAEYDDDFVSGTRIIHIMPPFNPLSPTLTSVTPLNTTQSAFSGTANIGFEIPEY